jgi:hypothetical protein
MYLGEHQFGLESPSAESLRRLRHVGLGGADLVCVAHVRLEQVRAIEAPRYLRERPVSDEGLAATAFDVTLVGARASGLVRLQDGESEVFRVELAPGDRMVVLHRRRRR